MEERKETEQLNQTTDVALHAAKTEADATAVDPTENEPLEKNVRLMSPTRMVLRRFFRSKLSIVGLVMIVSLFLFCYLGPVVYTRWGETERDEGGKIEYTQSVVTYTTEDGQTHTCYQVVETQKPFNSLAKPGADHLLGTDDQGMDVFTRLMYGGRVSLAVSFIAVFAITIMGIVFGGIAGYFGGWVDNVIMRICDVLMCLPGFPILLIIGTLLDATGVGSEVRIYYLMAYLTLFSWSGTARLVRGQILSLREQEYMVAAEAMGYSTSRKIFKHLVPNVMPQLIVSMTLSLGSMILYEASLSYLGIGVRAPQAAWGTMINIVTTNTEVFESYFNIWGPPGICIVLAVLGFNFVGDGLRDALDPKMRR
ncbi:MAG: ABC transporter permease [Clostridia bacterium]|nr:ABC transporter permease [Clostridia bacterium]